MSSSHKGFTLIEIIVSVTIFTIVMLIAVGAVLNAVQANRKAQTLNVVINNLNLAFESMIRDIRTGSEYRDNGCGAAGECIRFKDKQGRTVTYSFIRTGSGATLQTYIEKGPNNLPEAGRITSEEVILEEATFELAGEGDNDGPEVILLHLKGYAGNERTKSAFNIQTLITSRTLDVNELQ